MFVVYLWSRRRRGVWRDGGRRETETEMEGGSKKEKGHRVLQNELLESRAGSLLPPRF